MKYVHTYVNIFVVYLELNKCISNTFYNIFFFCRVTKLAINYLYNVICV